MDYSVFIPPLLPVLGGALQYARSFGMGSGTPIVAAAILGIGAYLLITVPGGDWRVFTISGLINSWAYMGTILGGTAITNLAGSC